MNVEIHLSSATASLEKVASVTRRLLVEVRHDVDPKAHFLAQQSGQGDKGDAISVSQIALAMVTNGTIAALAASLFSFIKQNRKIEVELRKSADKAISVKIGDANNYSVDQLMSLIEEFMRGD